MALTQVTPDVLHNIQSNVTQVGNLGNLTVTGNISSTNYNYANGVSITIPIASALSTLTSNAAVQAGDIATIYANLGGVSGSLATLTSNAAVQAGSIATLTSNAAVQAGDIATLYANAGVQAGAIAGKANSTDTLYVGTTAIALNRTSASQTLTGVDISGGAVSATTGAFSSTASFAAGSATVPSITRTGDTNTGIFFPQADTMAFTEGGVESMRMNSSGMVGIPSSYAGRLDVVSIGEGLANGFSVRNANGGVALFTATGTAQPFYTEISASSFSQDANAGIRFWTSQGEGAGIGERMRIHPSGGVAIGTTTDPGATNLIVQGNITATNFLGTATTATTALNAIGHNQTWQDVTASRASGTNYTNSTGRPIFISVKWNRDDGTLSLTVDGLEIGRTGTTAGPQFYTLTAIVPAGSTYSATASGSGGTLSWYELR
jgi:hypothetical protein